MAAMARSAVGRFTLVQVPPDQGSLRDDLAALVDRWHRPLDREERAAASLVGAARHEEDLRAGLDAALVQPLAEAIRAIGARAAERGQGVPEARLALLCSVIEDRKSTHLNSSHANISYAVFCLKKKITLKKSKHIKL